MIVGLLIGCAIGILIAAVGVVCFTDTTFPEFFAKLMSVKLSESLSAAAVGVLAFVASVLILIPVHEAGHLVCGLLAGYKFVSFRIFSLTLIKSDGKLRVKRFSINGTGGQCLLLPPDVVPEKLPTGWYNIGGVLANLIVVLAVLPLLWIDGHPFLKESIVIFCLTGAFFILLNGIPMKISGAGNDGYNLFALRNNTLGKRGLMDSLRANALIQNGVRPKDMPPEWFVVPAQVDYSNPLEVSIPMMAASRLIDEMKFSDALGEFERLYAHKGEIIGLYVNEIACELVFLWLISGDIEGADSLIDEPLRRYIQAYRSVMSSKGRILCAIALIRDKDKATAEAIYRDMESRKNDYLLQGEVRSDLAIMKEMLDLQ